MRARTLGLAAVLALAVAAAVAAAGLWLLPRPGDAGPTSLEALGRHGQIPPFSLVERSGRRVGRDDLLGKVWVADFIYTHCEESCPIQSAELARLLQDVPDPDLMAVSFTVDPEHDTPEALRAYAERYGAGERWWFLTGDKRELHCLALNGFKLSVSDPAHPEPPACGERTAGAAGLLRALGLAPAPAWASHGSKGLVMLHSARVAVVDRAGEIRAYHLATDPDSMRRLRDTVRALLAER